VEYGTLAGGSRTTLAGTMGGMWEPFGTEDSVSRIAEAVRSAPSVFGSQPWSLRIVSGDRIELRANSGERDGVYRGEWARWTETTADPDPLTREFAISCGAALYNLRLAVRVAGHEASEWLLPDPDRDPSLLASVEIVTGRTKQPSSAVREMYEAMWLRHTSRQPFLAPVPMSLVVAMETAAIKERASLRLMHRPEVRAWLRAVAEADVALSAEQGLNTERGRSFRNERELLLSRAAPAGELTSEEPARRGHWPHGRTSRFEPQLMSLATQDDRPLDWLRAGLGLQHAILTATRHSLSVRYGMPGMDGAPSRYGVAVSFLTQPLEVDDINRASRRFRWHSWSWYGEVPQVVMRIGYAPVLPVTRPRIELDVTDTRPDPVIKVPGP
jgi:hypothetical protein